MWGRCLPLLWLSCPFLRCGPALGIWPPTFANRCELPLECMQGYLRECAQFVQACGNLANNGDFVERFVISIIVIGETWAHQSFFLVNNLAMHLGGLHHISTFPLGFCNSYSWSHITTLIGISKFSTCNCALKKNFIASSISYAVAITLDREVRCEINTISAVSQCNPRWSTESRWPHLMSQADL